MVKGVAKRVVVVRAQDSHLFEEAIFMMRDGGAVSRDALREACAVAEEYLRVHAKRRVQRMYTRAHVIAAACAGSGAVGAVWFLQAFLL